MWLHRFAKFVGGATFLLIIAGGLVTSTGSGLSVPDWPLSYGQFFPPMIGGIRFEHSHRLIAATVALLTFVLMMWMLKTEKRKSLRRLGLLSFAAVVLQAVLGGITVIYLLPTFVSVIHACLAQSFFCLLVAISILTSRGWQEAQAEITSSASSLHRLLIVTTALIYLQLILGAIVRHTSGRGIVFHVFVAFLVLSQAIRVVLRCSRIDSQSNFHKPAVFFGILVVIQIFLGMGAFIMKIMLRGFAQTGSGAVLFATAHQATGALLLATGVFMTLWSFRLFQSPESGSFSTNVSNRKAAVDQTRETSSACHE